MKSRSYSSLSTASPLSINDTLLIILSFLSPSSLQKTQLVSKLWLWLSLDNSIWKEKVQRYYPDAIYSEHDYLKTVFWQNLHAYDQVNVNLYLAYCENDLELLGRFDFDDIDYHFYCLHAAKKLIQQKTLDFIYHTLVLPKWNAFIAGDSFSHQALRFFGVKTSENELAKSTYGSTGFSLFHWAIICNQSEEILTALLRDYGASVETLSRAEWEKGEYDIYIQAGQTPLHLAASFGWLEKATWLLHQGANRNHRDKNDNTPLHLCADNYDMASLLMKNASSSALAACVFSRNYKDKTPLHTAVERNFLKILHALKDAGAMEADARLFNLAISKNHIQAVIFLLEECKDKMNEKLEASDLLAGACFRMTPLFLAAIKGHVEIVKLLLDAGADIEIKASSTNSFFFYNPSPLDIALMKEHFHISALINERRLKNFIQRAALFLGHSDPLYNQVGIELQAALDLKSVIAGFAEEDIMRNHESTLNIHSEIADIYRLFKTHRLVADHENQLATKAANTFTRYPYL